MQLDKVQLMVNLDMIGRLDDEKNVYLGGVPTAYGLSETLQPFFEASELKVTSYEHTASGVRSLFSRSDHYNFYRKDFYLYQRPLKIRLVLLCLLQNTIYF